MDVGDDGLAARGLQGDESCQVVAVLMRSFRGHCGEGACRNAAPPRSAAKRS
jgi:hypothetical protein